VGEAIPVNDFRLVGAAEDILAEQGTAAFKSRVQSELPASGLFGQSLIAKLEETTKAQQLTISRLEASLDEQRFQISWLIEQVKVIAGKFPKVEPTSRRVLFRDDESGSVETRVDSHKILVDNLELRGTLNIVGSVY
jgi:uncharacterized coiled-coil protein SlyX